MDPNRRFWAGYEPLHSLAYFHPRFPEAFAERGLHGFWNMYFAVRAAPLGAVTPGPVSAIFFNFAPEMVHKAIPKIWGRITPEDAVATSVATAVEVLEGLTEGIEPARVDAVVALLEDAVDALDLGARPLGAAWAGVPRPDAPLARLWLAASTLREHRGDGHVAAAAVAGLTGLENTALHVAVGDTAPRPWIRQARGWSDEEWDAAEDSLRDRGYLAEDGAVTPEGTRFRTELEARTDALAARMPQSAKAQEAFGTLAQITGATLDAGFFPVPNPVGLPRL